jgi:hypothetical protein
MQFAAHETFHVRDGWLHKGLKAIKSNPLIFAEQHATDTLGVGRNMVHAIRYWLSATGISEERKDKDAAGKPCVRTSLTRLGVLISKHDPFFEEDVTLWALHYNLVSNRKRATSWFWAFNKFPLTRFDGQAFVNYLTRWLAQANLKKEIAHASLQKDLNCIARTYTRISAKGRKQSPEDTFECPFSSLKLMEFLENSNSYKFNVQARQIPEAAMAYAICKYAQSFQLPESEKREFLELGFQEILSGEGSPGRAFLLNADSLVENLSSLEARFGKGLISYSKTAGLNLLKIKSMAPEKFLEEGYKGARL